MNKKEFPFHVKVGFKKLFDAYRKRIPSQNGAAKHHMQAVLDMAESNPILEEGFSDLDKLSEHQEHIDFVMLELFPTALQSNEIKFATLPFLDLVIESTDRFKNILKAAGEDYLPQLADFTDDQKYIMACNIILKVYYGYETDFSRPLYYRIPNAKGMMRTYRLLYNADFVSLKPSEEAPKITEEDIAELLDSYDNVALWKEKFPPHSWELNGFVIANMFNVTMDASISDFKTHLLKGEESKLTMHNDFQEVFQSIFQLKELEVGFVDYNAEDDVFETPASKNFESVLLGDKNSESSKKSLCDASHYALFKKKGYYTISNVDRYHEMYPKNVLYKKLKEKEIKSAIFVAITQYNAVLGVLEITSEKVNALNSINANKLDDVMPFLVDAVVRAKQQLDNDLELIIQDECTSIHPSVHWKFRKEAKRYFNLRESGTPAYYRGVVFEDVYPLYGQIDIKESSSARNEATKKDLLLQLKHVRKIIKKISDIEELPVYEQVDFRVTKFLEELKSELQVDSERRVYNFLRTEIIPMFGHLAKKNEDLKKQIDKYYELVDRNTGLTYKHRKDYDETVMLVNKRLASILDKQQVAAQQMYPHYFERFKTDGVEHNLYIGESITKQKSFHKVYLNNLRLWQLQVMCEMENSYYQLRSGLPIQLEVASMILVFNGALSLRFRMDEKRFDVDGTYNARYEVVKKRVDKANIKGTEERVTQPGKITIVYSQKEDEEEYLQYIEFLQHKKQLKDDVEVVSLEDLQGVTGLKAIRVSLLYSKGSSKKEYYTYDELLEELAD
ncbi:GAF domain-containing protein [Luteirhabdus pelagi]|uniref:GAF domain-containing protein n=1 Tax=Luteirhabdus pelagi TaxID=2792783 RepID=UPI00193993D1|nr:GAF domain-containing protein [Luteirhabdus pelagi]